MVDKLYIMLPEFNINKNVNWNKFINKVMENDGFKKWGIDNVRITIDMIKNGNIEFSEDTPEMHLYDYFEKNKDSFTETKISKVKYDFNKTPKENGLKARNNSLIDMMWGVLTNKDTAPAMLNPGGFDPQKKSARIVTLLSSNTPKTLSKMLGVSKDDIFNKLNSMSLDALDKLVETYKVQLDPLSPYTQIMLHQQNMTGAKLIGIYANHNANHALLQHTEVELGDSFGFTINGRSYTSLHALKNANDEYISKLTAGFLAASVDNVKDPVLASLNQNTFTANASMLLSRLGYNSTEIGLIMSQPIVRDITKKFFRESRSGKFKDVIVEEVLKEYQSRTNITGKIEFNNFKNKNFTSEELANNIMNEQAALALTDRSQTSDYSIIEFFDNQVAVGYLFKHLMSIGDTLSDLVSATRADTSNGAAGPDIANNINKIQKVDDYLDSMISDKFPLNNAYIIRKININQSEDNLRKDLLESPLPYLQAFYSLGVEATGELFNKYFPHYNNNVKSVVDTIKEKTKSGKLDVGTMNSIYNDLLAYVVSKNDVFGGQDITISTDQREAYITGFPKRFMEIKENNPDIAKLGLIQRLKYLKPNEHNPLASIAFKNVGSLNTALKERYMRDWQSLLYMNNPVANKLAFELFLYSYYRNGFAFGPSTFIHLAPTSVRKAMPGYIDSLNDMMNSVDSYEDFVNQYIYNHLDNRKIAPEISEESTIKFVKDGNIVDSFNIEMSNDSSSEDKKFVRKTETIDGVTSYEFMDYIGTRIKGKFVYYKLEQVDEALLNEAKYTRIEPLGYKNSFLEYQYGVTVEAMTSVIPQNSKDYNPNKSKNIKDAPYAEADIEGSFEGIPTDFSTRNISIEDVMDSRAAALEAYESIMGEKAPEAPLDKTLLDYEPNTNTTDADDNSICVWEY